MISNGSGRRRLLVAVGGLAATVLAGCLDGGDGSDGGSDDGNGGSDDGDGDEDSDDVHPGLVLDGVVLSSAFPLELVEPEIESFTGHHLGEGLVANVQWHYGEDVHWHQMPLTVSLEGTRTVRVRPVDDDLETVPLGEDEDYQAAIYPDEGTPDDLVGIELDGALLTLEGRSAGEGQLVVELVDGEEVVWEAPKLEVAVVAEGTQDE